MTTDRSLDELVDDVAREMTAIQSMPPIRARVLARLDAAPRRTRFSPFVWTAAVAAALLLCVLVIPLRRPPLEQAQVEESKPVAQVAAATRADDRSTAPVTSTAPAVVRTASRTSTPSEPEESPAEREWRSRRIVALEAIDGHAIQPGVLDVPLLSMAPVTTAPLVVTPLSSDDNDFE